MQDAAQSQILFPGRSADKPPASEWVAYGAIALFVALSYILTIGRYIEYLNHVLPHGDWFNYTVNWFANIDFYHAHGTLLTLAAVLGRPGNWFRLMSLSEVALMPVLAKQPYVICIINYIWFGIATAACYRLCRRLGSTMWAAFAVALIPWVWPINYGFADYTSLPVTGLDAAFNAVLLLAVAQAYAFVFGLPRAPQPASAREALSIRGSPPAASHSWLPRPDTASAIATGLAVGIAVRGRGNSLPVVGLVVLWPALSALWLAWRSRDARTWRNVVIVGAIAGVIVVQFYAQYWNALLAYYGVHASFVEAHLWTFRGARPFILNVPGFMYWRAENSIVCIGLTFASHAFALAMLLTAWWPRGRFSGPRHFAFRHLIAGGAVIYFGTYLVDLLLFANDEAGFSIYQSLLVWRPMLIGLSLILLAIGIEAFGTFAWRPERLALPVAVLALAWGLMWTRIFTPWDPTHEWPAPRTVERFAIGLDRLADDGPVAVLWYRGWNEPILNYYRLQNDLPPAKLFTEDRLKYEKLIGELPPFDLAAVRHPLQYYRRLADLWQSAKQLSKEHHDDLWAQSDYSEEKRARVLEQIEYQFTHASLIVLPEYLDQYRSDEPYSFYKFKNDWAAWLSSDAAPRFRVLMLLQETPSWRLLVIRREDIAKGQGDPLRLPYGVRPRSPPADYSAAVIRFR